MSSATPDVTRALEALPEELRDGTPPRSLRGGLPGAPESALPTGRLSRMWSLTALNARIAAGYAAYFLRSRFLSGEEKESAKNEAHLAAALRLLGSMTYLKGAVMKVGQMLASLPNFSPAVWVDTLDGLHFDAPPMHFSLLRELVQNELGSDPEDLFASFETKAFAAASLGQVHRARLRSGEEVAVKVQYPGIARAVRSDLENLRALLAPLRLRGDGANLFEQFDGIHEMVEAETDYLAEARHQETARGAFEPEDGIVVPGIYPEYSSARVLTMDFLPGVHAPELIESDPSQEERDRWGTLIYRACMRLHYGKELIYADAHPGNFLFGPDGRLGFIDFGACHRLTEEESGILLETERAFGLPREEHLDAIARGADLTEAQRKDAKLMDLYLRAVEWIRRPAEVEAAFDFGDDAYMDEGCEIYRKIAHHGFGKYGHVRNRPVNNWMHRAFLSPRFLCWRLKARVPVKDLHAEELRRAGLA